MKAVLLMTVVLQKATKTHGHVTSPAVAEGEFMHLREFQPPVQPVYSMMHGLTHSRTVARCLHD